LMWEWQVTVQKGTWDRRYCCSHLWKTWAVTARFFLSSMPAVEVSERPPCPCYPHNPILICQSTYYHLALPNTWMILGLWWGYGSNIVSRKCEKRCLNVPNLPSSWPVLALPSWFMADWELTATAQLLKRECTTHC
jgi:hypothetical protein